MPNKQHTIGMLGGYATQYGLPTNTAQEELSRRNVERFTPKNEDIIGEDKFGFGRLGNRIGNLLAAKTGMGESELPPEEARKYAITADAQDRFNMLRTDSPELWSGMSSEDKALTYKRYLADSAFDNEQHDLATQLQDDYVASYNLRIKEADALRRLGIETNDAEEAANQRRIDNYWKNRGEGPGVIYPLNSANPNAGVGVFIDREGNARGKDPQTGQERVWSPGEYNPDRPQRPPAPRAAGTGGRGAAAQGPSMTPTDQRIRVDDAINLKTQLRTSIAMANTMRAAVQEFGSVDFLSTAGAAVSVVQRLMDNVSSLARTASGRGGSDLIPVMGADGEITGSLNAYHDASIRQYINGHGHIAGELGATWAKIEGDGRIRATYRNKEEWEANVIRLAYTRARAREPGARQLSDADVRFAMRELGAASTDPESFRRVMLQGLHGDIMKHRDMIKFTHPELLGNVYAPGSLDSINELVDEFYGIYGDPENPRNLNDSWGTGANPGGHLTRPPAAGPAQPTQPDTSLTGVEYGNDEEGSFMVMPDGSKVRYSIGDQ